MKWLSYLREKMIYFDVFGSYTPPPLDFKNGFKADRAALREDWKKVMGDFPRIFPYKK